jgi:diguanylate cyclase (GGDEF)-like protein
MATQFKRHKLTTTLVIAILYWAALLLLSLHPVDTGPLLSLFLLAGLPLVLLGTMRVWKAGNRRIGELAFLDDLTGLLNRRAFMHRATEVIEHSKPGIASLILLDVDGLKLVNDECGHQAGDELLERLGRRLSELGPSVYRIGGDEFAIIVDRSEGESVIRLLRSLGPVQHRFRTCRHDHVIQLSYGFAARRDHESFADVFGRADTRLRQFKSRLYTVGGPPDRRSVAAAAASELEEILSSATDEEAGGIVVSIFSRGSREKPDDAPRGSTASL